MPVTCAPCGKDSVAFGNHGQFTSSTTTPAKRCPKCQMWIRGKRPRCRTPLT